jgi:hypothetical protein
MNIELSVDELQGLVMGRKYVVREDGRLAEEDAAVCDVANYPPLEWSLNMATGHLIGSCDEMDGSFPLYEIWQTDECWRAVARQEHVDDGSLPHCLDACREDFINKIDADRAAGKVS